MIADEGVLKPFHKEHGLVFPFFNGCWREKESWFCVRMLTALCLFNSFHFSKPCFEF